MKLITGLGNPGGDYAATRHNVGFMVADLLADRLRAPSWSRKFGALLCQVQQGDERIVLLKPQTYMNLSGDAVQGAMGFYRVEPADLIVLHDDIDLELGRVVVKLGGGHGGHNGLRSIAGHIGPDFARVRMGVGRPGRPEVVDHVLSSFKKAELATVDAMLTAAADAVECILADGVQKAQNRYNVRLRARHELT